MLGCSDIKIVSKTGPKRELNDDMLTSESEVSLVQNFLDKLSFVLQKISDLLKNIDNQNQK